MLQARANSVASSVLDASSQSEALQRKADIVNNAAQREEAPRPNNTGMPDSLKSGIESLSGFSMDDVRVHYNSSKPATVQALAYTQGTDIHVAPGQEKLLPHEAWHVAQQMAGRVSPTTNINGMPVNDNAGLEHEADVMGEKAVGQRKEANTENKKSLNNNGNNVCQMLRVINGYEFFNNEEWKQKTPKQKQALRSGATDNLRTIYINEASNILTDLKEHLKSFIENLQDSKSQDEVIKDLNKLKPYASKIANKYIDLINNKPANFERTLTFFLTELKLPLILKLIKERTNTQIHTSLKEPFLEESENLAIVAHGSTDKFADFTPNELAQKVWPLLPNNYSGEIYLAGCQTGKQYNNESNDKTSYIQEFRKELMKYSTKDSRKNISPAIKGDRNYSWIRTDHVYVEGWDEPRKKCLFSFCDLEHDCYASSGNYRVRLYYGDEGQLHIDQTGKVTDSKEPQAPPIPELQKNILGILSHKPANIGTLCEYLNVDEGTMTTILDDLDKTRKIKQSTDGYYSLVKPPPPPPPTA